MKKCECHGDNTVHLLTATDGYFAAYRVEGQDHASLNNVVAWEAHECHQCHDVAIYALVVKEYAATLVRAQAIDGFVGISGPSANAGQKAHANEMLEREKVVRTQEAAQRAARRRTVTSTG